MSVTVSNMAVREWFHKTRESVKPWGDFIDTRRFNLPSSLPPLPNRVVRNISHFQGNYLFIFVGLFFFCILTSPGLLLAISVCAGACFFISFRNTDQPLVIKGYELTVSQQYRAVAALSFPLFWFAGAGSAVFWIIGASVFVILLHASAYKLQEGEDFDVEMDSIHTVS